MPNRVPTFRPRALAAPDVEARQAHRDYSRFRRDPEAQKFYESPPWRKLKAVFKRQHPLCAECEAAGRVTLAAHVHHIVPRRDRPDLALDWSNLQSLCHPCHNRKTGAEKKTATARQ